MAYDQNWARIEYVGDILFLITKCVEIDYEHNSKESPAIMIEWVIGGEKRERYYVFQDELVRDNNFDIIGKEDLRDFVLESLN